MVKTQRLDLIFGLKTGTLGYTSLNNVLFNHYKESLLDCLETGVTYDLSVHFIDWSSYNNNIFTFKNINFVNHDTPSREDLHGFLSENAYAIWSSNNNILGYKDVNDISLNLMGILVGSNDKSSDGYDFDGLYIG